MSAPAGQLSCVKRDGERSCGGRPVVRYAVGWVCSRHQVPGAQPFEWLVDTDQDLQLHAAASTAAAALGRPTLPDPGRRVAAVHADAAPGETNAAALVAYKAGTLRTRVLAHLVDVGLHGTTAIEAWRWYQANHSPSTERYSIAPRLSEMVTDGWAVKTGALRHVRGAGYPPEEVYVLSPGGRREKGLSW